MAILSYKDSNGNWVELPIISNENKIEIDAELSDISENPVQNKVVKKAIDDINKEISNNASWTGTKSEWESLDKSELEDGQQINITDDDSNPSLIDDSVTNRENTWSSAEIDEKINLSLIQNKSFSQLQKNFSVNSSRATNIIGGYMILGNLMIVDITYTHARENLSGGDFWGIFKDLPPISTPHALNVSAVSKAIGCDWTCTYTTNGSIEINTGNVTLNVGDVININGMFLIS